MMAGADGDPFLIEDGAQIVWVNSLNDNRVGLTQVSASGTTVTLFTDSSAGTSWTAGTRRVMTTLAIEVQ